MNREQLLDRIRHGEVIQRYDLSALDLTGADLSGGTFEQVRFAGAQLEGLGEGGSYYLESIQPTTSLPSTVSFLGEYVGRSGRGGCGPGYSRGPAIHGS